MIDISTTLPYGNSVTSDVRQWAVLKCRSPASRLPAMFTTSRGEVIWPTYNEKDKSCSVV